MDARLSDVAQQLLLIERELRVLGLWASAPPSPVALASAEPFCVDTLEFEEWLQWIFLPRMKAILEDNQPLPRCPASIRWLRWSIGSAPSGPCLLLCSNSTV